MLLARRLVPFLVLPILVFLESMAWYALRTVQWPYLSEVVGGDIESVGTLITASYLVTAVGAVFAGLVGLGIGPWGVLPLGLLLAAGGAGTLPMTPAGLEMVPLLITAVGMGAVRASVWGLAVVELAAPRENLRTALLVLTYGALNAGGLAGPFLADRLREALGYSPIFYGTAGLFLVAALLAVVPIVMVLVDRMPRSDGDRARRLHLPTLAASGMMVLVLAPVLALLTQGSSSMWRAIYELDSDLLWLGQLNPMVVLLAAPVVAGALVAVHFGLHKTVPGLLIAGPGLILWALAVAAGLVGNTSVVVLGLAIAVIAVAEVLTTPALYSRFLGDLHWRVLTLTTAVWVATQSVLWWAVDGLAGLPQTEGLQSALGWLGIGAAVVVGLALTVAAIPLQRSIYAWTEAAESH